MCFLNLIIFSFPGNVVLDNQKRIPELVIWKPSGTKFTWHLALNLHFIFFRPSLDAFIVFSSRCWGKMKFLLYLSLNFIAFPCTTLTRRSSNVEKLFSSRQETTRHIILSSYFAINLLVEMLVYIPKFILMLFFSIFSGALLSIMYASNDVKAQTSATKYYNCVKEMYYFKLNATMLPYAGNYINIYY